ncbi:MAG: TetR/AcrR family transcriptional regulator [Pseudomonadota bacterium]
METNASGQAEEAPWTVSAGHAENARAQPLWRDQKSSRTRQAVLRAAIQCLFREGLKPTTIQKISEQAGISRGAIMHHFDSRDHVIREVIRVLCEERLQELRELLHATRQSLDAHDADGSRVDRILESLWEFYRLPSFVVLQELSVVTRSDERMKQMLASSQKLLDIGMSEEIGLILGPDLPPDVDSRLYADLLLFNLHGATLNHLSESLPPRTRSLLEQLVRNTLRVLGDHSAKERSVFFGPETGYNPAFFKGSELDRPGVCENSPITGRRDIPMARRKSKGREDTWQAEKSENTRNVIMEATVKCYVEYGYTNTTVTKIATTAGVSRGAMMHHFADRQDVIIASVAYLSKKQLDEFRSLVAAADIGDENEVTEEKLRITIDSLWKFFHLPSYVAYLELLIAARTDDELAKIMKRSQLDFDRQVNAAIRATFPAWKSIESTRELVTDLWFYTLQGMATTKIINRRQTRVKNLLELLVRETFELYVRSTEADDSEPHLLSS